MIISLPDTHILNKLLRYEPQTGKLFWKSRARYMFTSSPSCNAWNARWATKEAFTSLCAGYKCGSIFYKGFLAHRIIWKMTYGADPTDQLDHINHNRTDNRLKNLREATYEINHKNQSKRSNNTSGFTGVSWDKSNEKWEARIRVSKKPVYIGRFNSITDAVAARKAAEIKYGFHPNHGL